MIRGICRYLSALFLLPAALAAQQPVTLRFCNLQKAQGSVFVAVYNRSEGFLDEKKAFYAEVIPVKQTGCLEKQVSLPEGAYAVSCFHDANANGQMDKSWMGIPKEPYGFSGNYTAKMRPPNWEETQVRLKPGQSLTVQLKNW